MSGLFTTHRPADVWLNDLKKAKAEGNTGNKPKTTIQDLLERINDPGAPESALIPSSPRSVQSCFLLGIDPVELQFHPLDYYRRHGEDEDIAQLRYEKNEEVRQERIRELTETRKMLIDENWTPEAEPRVGAVRGPEPVVDSTMVEKERKRLEVSKARTEKDLNQMVQHEVKRKELLDKQQRKIDELERRAQEHAREKAASEAAWLANQRKLELQKLAEEHALEREAARLAEERYQREKEIQDRLKAEEKQRRREATEREIERRNKVAEAQRETQAILDHQAALVEESRKKMEAQDKERARRMQVEAEERAAANEEKRRRADARIASALKQNEDMLAKKRADFQARERAAEQRRAELDEIRKEEDERKRQEEIRKEQERNAKYQAALEREEARKKSIQDRADHKERMLAELYARRKKEHDMKKVESDFELKLRLDKVDSIQKHQCYQRDASLKKIMTDFERTRSTLREKDRLQKQRKQANMDASLQRHKMTATMDKLKSTKNLDSLGGPGGVSINDLLR